MLTIISCFSYFNLAVNNAHVRATGQRKAGSMQVQRLQRNTWQLMFSLPLTAMIPLLETPIILVLEHCHCLLYSFLHEYLWFRWLRQLTRCACVSLLAYLM